VTGVQTCALPIFLEAVRETLARRPELLALVEFTGAELKLLQKAGLMDRVVAAAEKGRGE